MCIRNLKEIFPKINSVIKFLKKDDYEINEESKSALLTTQGMDLAEKLLMENNLISLKLRNFII